MKRICHKVAYNGGELILKRKVHYGQTSKKTTKNVDLLTAQAT
jgi:hypothetical protein